MISKTSVKMARLPDLEAIAIFAKVVETRGITAASVELGLSPPTISKALTRLEQRIGARLLNRTARRLLLTDAGHTLAAGAAQLLADGEAAENLLRDAVGAARGQVRLAVPMSFGTREVAPLIPEFLRRYPQISIDLHLGDALVDLLGEGFDIALRICESPDPALRAQRLAPVPAITVAAPAYLQRHGRPTHPSELANHVCFSYAYLRTRETLHFFNDSDAHVSVRPGGSLRVNNGDALLPALIAGLGIAVLPAFLIRDALASGDLEQILPRWHRGHSSLYLLTPPAGPRPVRVQLMADYLTERLSRT